MKNFIKISILFFAMLQKAQAQEIKFGIMQHDFDTKLGHRYEKGKILLLNICLIKCQTI